MQLFLELRGIVQKSRAQFWLKLVSKGKRTHTCMDSEISLIAPDCHLRLHRNGKSPFGTKTWYTFKRDFMVAIASLNVWQRVSRGMMIYDNLAFLQLEGSETGFLTVPLQHQFSDVLGRRRSTFSTTNSEGDVSWRNIRTKSSRGSGN